ncbi:MAG TPA: GNAT family N-acetyltransferase [Nitrospirae bacterium]|nr:GNAT family N-acetyltransferase [Nitrospirota bacterium]
MENLKDNPFLIDIDQVDSLFNKLVFRTEQADPICCRTEWQISFHEAFSPFRSLIINNTEDSLIAFATYFFPSVGYILEPLENHWFFACPLLGDNPNELLISLLQKEPFLKNPPYIIISGLIRESKITRTLIRFFQKRYDISLLEPTLYRSASLEDGLDGYLSRRTAKLRKNLKSAERKAQRENIVFEFVNPKSIQEADSIYSKVTDIERRSWKGINNCGITVQPSYSFYRLLIMRMTLSKTIRILFARHGSKYIGYMFGGVAGGYYRGQQFSYDEDYSHYSIGNLLQINMINRLAQENIQRYDMGQDMEYKRIWAEIRLETNTILLKPKVYNNPKIAIRSAVSEFL